MPMHLQALEALRSTALTFVLFCGTLCGVSYAQHLSDSHLLNLFKQAPAEELSAVVLRGDKAEVLSAFQENKALKPASVLKLITSAAALDALGPEHRFITEFLWDRNTLFVRGGGNPVLTTEDIWIAVREIKARGVKSLSSVVLVTDRYRETESRSGHRAYNATPTALTFNFNSVRIDACGDGKGKCLTAFNPDEAPFKISSKVTSGATGNLDVGTVAADTPLLLEGTCIGRSYGCVSVYRSVPDPATYFGSVLISLLEQGGIDVVKSVTVGKVSRNAELLYRHESRPLREIVTAMNQLSTNVLAEQMVYELGCKDDGTCSKRDGLLHLERYLKRISGPTDRFHLEDGSGLSHSNRVSALTVAKILFSAVTHPKSGAEYEASLAVGERSGTLKKRDVPERLRGKTGFIDGVSSLAGIALREDGKKIIFVLLQNGVTNREHALEWEEKVVAHLFDHDFPL